MTSGSTERAEDCKFKALRHALDPAKALKAPLKPPTVTCLSCGFALKVLLHARV